MHSSIMLRALVVLVAAFALVLGASGARPRAASAAWQLTDAHGVAGQAVSSDGLCESCTWLVKTVRCEATDPDAQAALISMVLSEVCAKLGGELASQCSQLVPQLVPVAVMMLGSYSAKELCADMALCSTAAVRGTPRVQPGQLSLAGGCGMCKYLARSAAEHPGAALEQVRQHMHQGTAACKHSAAFSPVHRPGVLTFRVADLFVPPRRAPAAVLRACSPKRSAPAHPGAVL